MIDTFLSIDLHFSNNLFAIGMQSEFAERSNITQVEVVD